MSTEGRRPPGFDPDRDVMLDARNLRGLVHPLRVRMLAILREDGPATATMLAQRLGESSGATSYHLRQLAEFGFIVEDARQGPGRQRWWRAAHRSTWFDTAADSLEETGLLGVEYLRNVARGAAARMDGWVDALPSVPPEWRDAGTMSDYRLALTPDQARALIGQLEAIGLANRTDEGAAADPSAQPVILQFQVLPYPSARTDRESVDADSD